MIIPIFSFLISVFLRAEGYLLPCTKGWEAIVFNYFVKNAWDVEERRRIPFSLHSVMSLRIKIEESRFLIRIGENWFKSFEHRVPFKLIEQLYIVGFEDIPLLKVTDNEGIGL
ncbi:hypothetical protein CAEBREN_23914 [Caenorhabditis brenneri]|uniref:Galectin n=1 Tax=Caenorhabditis brenneri TaxID=135651 RepID=G0PGA2_CAEBE|nr:hypothetical protein CAEBREN_23914 [Caenorhabditis brenneri]